MIETVDEKWSQTKNLFFQDTGPVMPGARTRLFTVRHRVSNDFLGEVRWYAHWRQYVFMPVNAIFDRHCLREIADFCETKTLEQRAKAKA